MAESYAARPGRWTRRDWITVAVVGLVSGLALLGMGKVSEYQITVLKLDPPNLGWSYPVWFLPGLVAAAVIRKPWAFMIGESLAGLVEFLLIAAFVPTAPVTTCSFAGCDLYLISGLVQGLGGELALAARGYRAWGPSDFAWAGVASWWFGWTKSVTWTGCYTWSEPGLLITATWSTALVGAGLGWVVQRVAPQPPVERGV